MKPEHKKVLNEISAEALDEIQFESDEDKRQLLTMLINKPLEIIKADEELNNLKK